MKVAMLACLMLFGCDPGESIYRLLPIRTVVVTNYVMAERPFSLDVSVRTACKFDSGEALAYWPASESIRHPNIQAMTVNPWEFLHEVYPSIRRDSLLSDCGVCLFTNTEPYKVDSRLGDDTSVIVNTNVSGVLRARLVYAYYRVDHVRVAQIRLFVSNE